MLFVLCIHLTQAPDVKPAGVREQTLELLDRALASAMKTKDPRNEAGLLLDRMVRIDEKLGLEALKKIRIELAKRTFEPQTSMQLSPRLAAIAAPYDKSLRNELLREAVAEGKRTLENQTIWKAPGEDPKIGFVFPQLQLDQDKQDLGFRIRLWEMLLAVRGKPDEVLHDLERMMREPMPFLGGTDVIMNPKRDLEHELSQLDAGLYIEYLSSTKDKSEMNQSLAYTATTLYLQHHRNPFQKKYWNYCLKNGAPIVDIYYVLMLEDPARTWIVALHHQDEENARITREKMLREIAEEWVWREPNAALSAILRDTHEETLQELLNSIARTWSLVNPKEFDRLAAHMENDYNRNHFAKLAAYELDRRKRGLPPRDRRELKPAEGDDFREPSTLGADLRKKHPFAAKLLENPRDPGWIEDRGRRAVLIEAAHISMLETGNADITMILAASIANDEDRDSFLLHFLNQGYQYRTPAIDLSLMRGLKSERRFRDEIMRRAIGLVSFVAD